MIYIFISYCISILIFFIILRRKKTIYYTFPKIHINKKGICFYSTLRHRLNISNATMLALGKNLFLKSNGRTVVVKNISNIYATKKYVYFNTNGKCEICFPCSRLFKYFNIKITCNLIDIQQCKTKAINAIVNNLFCLSHAQEIKNYLKLIREVFKINITKRHLIIKQNAFNMSYVLEYVANNVYKTINVN